MASLDPDSDAARFLGVRLKREENRIEAALVDAIGIINLLLPH